MIKLKSLLNEIIGNLLERIYGHWIDHSGNMLPIKRGENSHEKMGISIIQNLVKTGIISQKEYDDLHIPFNGSSAIDNMLYNKGFLRGIQNGTNEYYVNGRRGQKLTPGQQKALSNFGKEYNINVIYFPGGESEWMDKIMVYDKNAVLEDKGDDEGDEIDIDRLFYNDYYLEKIASRMEYDDDFNKQFWSQHYLPILYHCTTKENYDKIKIEGLKMKSDSRGATSNRHIGKAVFTTAEELEIPFFKSYYGPVVIGINAKQMKADGFMPDVEKEPDWARAEMLEFVLKKLDRENAEASMYVDSSDQNTQWTVIVYSDIPIKYLSLIEYD